MNHLGTQGLGASRFEALVQEHTGGLYRMALALTRDPGAAEDLVQEALLRAWRGRAGFRGDASPLTWLRRILHHAAIDRARRGGRELPVADVEAVWRDDAFTVDADAVLEQAADRADLEDALIRLPFIYRSVVVLHDIEGYSSGEVAEILDAGLPAVKQRLRRGRMMLVSALSDGAARRAAMKGVPMSCWNARRHVSDYLDGGLAPESRRLLEEHVARCPTCPPLYASLVGVRDLLGELRDPDSVVPPTLAARISAAR